MIDLTRIWIAVFFVAIASHSIVEAQESCNEPVEWKTTVFHDGPITPELQIYLDQLLQEYGRWAIYPTNSEKIYIMGEKRETMQTRICDPQFFSWAISSFDIDYSSWFFDKAAHNPDNACDISKPLGQLLAAIYTLTYAGSNPTNSTSDLAGTPLRWAWAFTAKNSKDIHQECRTVKTSRVAVAKVHPIPIYSFRNHMVLYGGYFYSNWVNMASILVHEARHMSGKSHDASPMELGPVTLLGTHGCEAEASCDSAWTYWGANTFEALYYWDFYLKGSNFTSPFREYAKIRGNYLIDNGFRNDYYFSIGNGPTTGGCFGSDVDGPHWSCKTTSGTWAPGEGPSEEEDTRNPTMDGQQYSHTPTYTPPQQVPAGQQWSTSSSVNNSRGLATGSSTYVQPTQNYTASPRGLNYRNTYGTR